LNFFAYFLSSRKEKLVGFGRKAQLIKFIRTTLKKFITGACPTFIVFLIIC